MIYIDSSVSLAAILLEQRRPDPDFWQGELASSRLLEYETIVVAQVKSLSEDRFVAAKDLLGRIKLFDLDPVTLARALEPFPGPLRTLDALHIATASFLQARGLRIELASYDDRLNTVARAVGIPLARL
jgi:predicted nucleic acid-binding protein